MRIVAYCEKIPTSHNYISVLSTVIHCNAVYIPKFKKRKCNLMYKNNTVINFKITVNVVEVLGCNVWSVFYSLICSHLDYFCMLANNSRQQVGW